MKRVIITGATGVIGTALINELLSHNIEILVICRKNSDKIDRIPSCKLITKKYCDLSEFYNLQNDTGKDYDVFYHFAWEGTTGISREDMYLQNNNVKYALDAVNLAKRFGCKVFIGSGSQAEYGRVDMDLDAMTPTFPENGYGIAKLCAGQMTRNLCRDLGIMHIWTRILSVYGAYDNPNSLIMSTINKIKNNEELNVTKCEQIWDYIYSKDVARIFYSLGQKGIDGKTYIIGSGIKRHLYEYVEDIKNEINKDYKINFGNIPYSNNQVMYLCANTSELKKDLNFECEYTFKQGIKELIEWNEKRL